MTTVDVEVVDIRKSSMEGKLKAFADVKIAGALIVKGFAVMDGQNGIFVAPPKKPGKNGQWFEVITLTDDGLKRDIEGKVLEAYDRETDGVTS